MNKALINQLLDKYWDAETSVEEENILKAYFNQNLILDEHKPYQELFNHFQSSSQLTLSKDITLSDEIIRSHQRKNGLIYQIRPLMKYAAAIIFLMIGYGTFINYSGQQLKTQTSQYAGKYTEFNQDEDIDEALAITMEALSFLKTKINQTEEEVTAPMEPITKAINKINQ